MRTKQTRLPQPTLLQIQYDHPYMCLMIQANKDTWKRKNPSALRSLQKVSLHWLCPIMCICCKTPPIMALKRSLYPSPPPPVLPLHDLGWHPLDPQSQGETLLLLLLSLQIRSAGVCIERERERESLLRRRWLGNGTDPKSKMDSYLSGDRDSPPWDNLNRLHEYFFGMPTLSPVFVSFVNSLHSNAGL